MILIDDDHEIPVEYVLVKEGDRWLIDTIKVEDMSEHQMNDSDETFDTTPLQMPITEMMNQIHQGQLKKAYEDYTSQEFQKTTTFKEFEDFIQSNHSFGDYQSIEFTDLSFDNNIATLSGILKTSDGKNYHAEYDLTEEKGGWKIFHVLVSNASDGIKDQAMQFTKFVVGTGLDDHNVVTSPTKVFKQGIEDIFLNLYLSHVKANTKVEVVFKHMETDSSIPAVSKMVSESGDVVLAFIFSPPPSGWPVGNYRLEATSSTGESAMYDFKVGER
jgi:hypothetical protein